MCCYFDDISKTEYFDFDNILLNKKIIWKYFDLWCFVQIFDWSKTFVYYVEQSRLIYYTL